MTHYSHFIFIGHAASTFFMTGLIWIIQLLHYPSYRFIQPEKFSSYQNFHTNRITFIVGPVMLIEVLSGMYLTVTSDGTPVWTLNFVGLCLIWLSTLFFSIPAHNQLHWGYNEKVISRLINTNWLRTLTWSFRSLLMLYLLF